VGILELKYGGKAVLTGEGATCIHAWVKVVRCYVAENWMTSILGLSTRLYFWGL
jgi:hypothetical protein